MPPQSDVGTNYPMITAAKALEHLDQLGLDGEAEELFRGGNAARVFKRRHARPVPGPPAPACS